MVEQCLEFSPRYAVMDDEKSAALVKSALRDHGSRTEVMCWQQAACDMAANYGGRWYIVQGVRQLAQQLQEGLLRPEQIDEEMLGQQVCMPVSYTHLDVYKRQAHTLAHIRRVLHSTTQLFFRGEV